MTVEERLSALEAAQQQLSDGNAKNWKVVAKIHMILKEAYKAAKVGATIAEAGDYGVSKVGSEPYYGTLGVNAQRLQEIDDLITAHGSGSWDTVNP